MDRKKQAILGLAILIILIIVIVAVTTLKNNKDGISDSNLKQVFVATGGGKENFLADEEVNNIMKQKYGLKVTYDSWSNGKIAKGEAQRDRILEGGLTLNTPIVIYSWDTVVDALIKENIVTQKDNVYYITDMNKLISYILEGKKWSDIGVDMLYGTINIDSTDPVTSSPGATYYGLLLSIMCGGTVTEENLQANLQNLKEFYIKSGYMNNTPADLFELYLKTGVGGKPMIVDYEKSVIDFANSNPDGWEQVKDKIRILYPTPTIWNSHCIATFNETGNEFFKAFEDKDIGQIAWSRYGFRTGITGGNYDVTKVNVSGIPQSITSTVSSLKMKMYDEMISYLGQ